MAIAAIGQHLLCPEKNTFYVITKNIKLIREQWTLKLEKRNPESHFYMFGCFS